MSINPWFRFYPTDWRGDAALRSVSFAARGLWMDMISLMHEAEPYGHLLVNSKSPDAIRLARMLGGNPKEVSGLLRELEEEGVFSRTDEGTIYSRRMVRDCKRNAETSAAGRENGLLGGNPDIRRGTVPKDHRTRRFRRSDNPAKARRIFDKDSGECHWCHKELTYDGEGPNLYHVDHVTAIADGGTNDDDNLVASCAACNHARARVSWSDPNGSGSSDPNGSGLGSDGADHKPHGARAPPSTARSQKEGSELRSAADAAPDGPRSVVWSEGLERLQRLTGLPVAKARTRLGQLLRLAGDDCPRLLAVLRECPETGDPQAWLTRAAEARAGQKSAVSKLGWMMQTPDDDPLTIDAEPAAVETLQ